MRRRISSACLVCVVAVSLSAVTLNFQLQRVSTQPVSVEWHQDAHDAQRTGYVPVNPDTPWTFRWAFNGAGPTGGTSGHIYNAPREARTVAGGGNVYIPAGALGIYAKRLTDGAEQWRFTASTVNATPAYDPATGMVFAGGANGTLYKINALNGTIVGTYVAGSPLNKAVLLAGGFAYVVTDSGTLHKVNMATMALAWNTAYAAGSTIATPPSYSALHDVIVYATDDLYVHCVNNSDGSRRWRVKPTPNPAGFPNEFEYIWPVIAEQHGIVFLRMRLAHSALDPFGAPFPTSFSSIRTWLINNPQHQNLFALRLSDGEKAFIPAVGYGGTEDYVNGAAYSAVGPVPVVKRWPSGEEVAYIHFRWGDCGGCDYRWDSHMGEMVLDSTTIAGLAAGDLRFVGMEKVDTFFVRITDEQCPITMAGDTLIHSHWASAEILRITNRSSTRGLSYSNTFVYTKYPTIVHCGTGGTPNWTTRFNTGYMNLCGDTRGLGDGFFSYAGLTQYAPPGSPQPGAYSAGILPRYCYVSGQYIVYEGNGGDILVLQHSGTVPN